MSATNVYPAPSIRSFIRAIATAIVEACTCAKRCSQAGAFLQIGTRHCRHHAPDGVTAPEAHVKRWHVRPCSG